jgi:lipopolysaccharide/colanic/teichoic acid biosynthesis glycosyltransferase
MIRVLDIIFSFLGLIFFSPLFFIISLLVKFSSTGPIFYRQVRVGKNFKDFYLLKFRTMKINADQLGLLTVGGRDPRVTSIGYYLRKFKLDELPQLWNVLIGEMSLVGPRPEVRKYVEQYNDSQKNVLSIKPGITDWASILYKNENEILEKSLHPELDYVNIIMPDKIRYNFIFINNYTITEYFKILFETVYRLFIG